MLEIWKVGLKKLEMVVTPCAFVPPVSKQLALCSIHVAPFVVPRFRGNHKPANFISFPQGNCKGCYVIGNNVKRWIAEYQKIGSMSTLDTRWENPDDGSESEYEGDEGSEAENDLDFESDGEEKATDGASSITIVNDLSVREQKEDLMREAEQLLSPDERAILHSNESPLLEKISTKKWNTLHTYALAGQIKCMDMLFEKGVHVDQADKDGLTALHHATISKKEAVISHLLRKGANPQPRDLDGVTPLHYAVQVSAMQTVKLLIKYNVDVNVADNEGWTPLHIAMQSRNRDIAKILLVNGADIYRKNKEGKTPLDLSLCYGKDFKSYDLAKLLKLVTASRGL